MTSSVAGRRGASFTIAELIGSDENVDGGNHDNNNNNSEVACPLLGNQTDRDFQDIHQMAWHRQPTATNGAFHVYRPTSSTNSNFYQACLNWMRSRGMISDVPVEIPISYRRLFSNFSLARLIQSESFLNHQVGIGLSPETNVDLWTENIISSVYTVYTVYYILFNQITFHICFYLIRVIRSLKSFV